MTLIKKTGPLQYLRDHKCWKYGFVYAYDINRPDNSYIDWEDSKHFDCPRCKKPYYPVFQDINIIGNLVRNIFC